MRTCPWFLLPLHRLCPVRIHNKTPKWARMYYSCKKYIQTQKMWKNKETVVQHSCKMSKKMITVLEQAAGAPGWQGKHVKLLQTWILYFLSISDVPGWGHRYPGFNFMQNRNYCATYSNRIKVRNQGIVETCLVRQTPHFLYVMVKSQKSADSSCMDKKSSW